MNDAVAIDTSDLFVERAVPLLKEYLDKAIALKEELRKFRGQPELKKSQPDERRIVTAEYGALEKYFKRLRPAMLQFSQQVSGMIDQGNVTPLERAELRLRLAELESILLDLPNLINAYRPV